MTELKSKNKLDRKLEKQENSQYAILEFINMLDIIRCTRLVRKL